MPRQKNYQADLPLDSPTSMDAIPSPVAVIDLAEATGQRRNGSNNPQQDRALFDEILSEVTAYKGELLGAWTGNIPLSGGAGHRIVALRATPHTSRESLLSSAAEQIHIRATGHGWCLAQGEGCGGAGLYEAYRCVDCKNAVIDDSFADIWLGIHEQQRELLALDDVGPAVQQRARRDADRSATVLSDLGIEIPQEMP